MATEDGIPAQVASLARTVLAFAKNVDNVETILPNVRRICHKHVARGIEASQYDAVGESLLYAMKEELGEAATEGIMTAWAEAFGFLANTFITIEAELKESLSKSAGFEGLVDMAVSSKREDGTIGLVPVGHPVPPYGKGQFVALKIDEHMTSMRLVQGNAGELTITIPRNEEKATKELHEAKTGDVIQVSMPCGKAL